MSSEIPKTLIEKIQNNEVIPFVGAGISTGVKDVIGNALFLSWNELLLSSVKILEDNNKIDEADYIKSSIKVAKTSDDYMNIACKIKEYLSSQWQEYLEINFKKNFDKNIDIKTLDIPKEIWNLGKLIITTNYDNVMHWSNNDKHNLITWDINSIAGQVKSLKEYPKNDTLWHLHGRIDNLDNIVLTKESYENVYGNNSDIKGAIEVLKSHMTTKSFIFLGFSLDDIYLKEQLKKVKSLFKEYSNPHYIILKEGRETDLSEFGDISPIYIKNYEDDYLRVLKEMTKYKDTKNCDTVQEVAQEIYQEDEIIPFNIPFKSKEKGAIGIEDKLKEVHQTLSSTQKTTIGQKASFQGMGGLGKTQLAVEYAYRYKEEFIGGIIWLTIDQNFDEQLLELASKCAWVNPHIEAKEKIEIAKEKLFALKNVLVILDNVDTKDEIKELYEKLSENKILVTSRNAIQGFSSIPLDTLNEENSLKLLVSESCREIKLDELEYAIKVSKELDGLPLALEMAGSYVEFKALSWKDYYELYKEDGVSFLDESNIESYTNHEINISKTLSLSDSILEQEPLLEKVIYLLAWSANESIDKKLISILLDEKEVKLSEPISLGVKLKFIKQSDDGYTLHRLVRDIWQKREPLKEEFAIRVSENLSSYMKEIKDDFLRLKELDKASLQAKSWAKLLKNRNLKASLINYSVYPDYHMGNYKDALKNIDKIYKLFDESEESGIYAEILNNKGFLTGNLGNSKEAKPYLEKALQMNERLYKNSDHPYIATSLNNMGVVLRSLGDLKEAKPYYEKALHMNERLYKNSDHPYIASSLNNMGVVVESLGDSEEAKPYYEKALEMRERLYKESDHPDIANSLNNMGSALKSVGDLKEAKPYFEKALEMRERLYKESDHPDIASSLNNMGGVLESLGDSEEAKPYLEKAFEMRERLYKESDHPYIANSLNNMGVVLESLGNSEEAKPYYEKALEMRERLYKESDHPDIASSLNNMGGVLELLGDSEGAKPYYEKAYKMNERKLGKVHPDTVLMMINYIRCIASHPLNKGKAIKILKEYKKELKDNKELLHKIDDELKKIEPKKIGRNNSKRKKRR